LEEFNRLRYINRRKGDSVEFNVTSTHLQYKYSNDNEFKNLLDLSLLTGAKGDKGDSGSEIELTVDSGYIKWKYKDEESWKNLIDLKTLTGAKGEKGDSVEFNVTSTHLQYKYSSDNEFKNLLDLSLLTGEKGDKGDSGSEIELTVDSGYIKWKYKDEESWKNLIDLKTLTGAKGDKGDAGREVEFNVSSTHIQWKYKDDSNWKNLIELDLIKGAKGDQGKTVEFRVDGVWVQWKYITDTEWINLYEINGNIAPEGLVNVKFILNGGSLDGYESELTITQGYSIEFPKPKKDGYTFIGWYEDLSDEYEVTSPYRVHESINLYAKWEAGAKITGTKIYNLNDLAKIKNNLSGTYVLMNDINCNGLALKPIGTAENPFTGIFEGQGYSIYNYKLSVSQYNGLFGYNAGTIRNLNIGGFELILNNSTTSHPFYIGGLVGYNTGDIYSCSSEVGNINVKFTNQITDIYGGLLVGYNKGNIHDIIVLGYINTYTYYDLSGNNYVGGVTGYNAGTIKNGYVSCTVSAEYAGDDSYAGIVAGYNSKNIANCITRGTVYSNGYKGYSRNSMAGDIAAESNGTINNCYTYENASITSAGNNVKTFGTKMSLETMNDYYFYSLTLEWDTEVWDYTKVDLLNGLYPKLNQKE